MDKIGFKNFRKFENLPLMDLSPITIFVGENNAGKSTVVKGILALSDFLVSSNRLSFNFERIEYNLFSEFCNDRKTSVKEGLKDIKFHFNTNYLAHIGTFQRALYNDATEECICFVTSYDSSNLSFYIKNYSKEQHAVYGSVAKIVIEQDDLDITVTFDLENDKASVLFTCIESKENPFAEDSKKADFFRKYQKAIKEDIYLESDISDILLNTRGEGLLSALVRSLNIAISKTLYPRVDFSSETRQYIPETTGIDEISLDASKMLKEVHAAFQELHPRSVAGHRASMQQKEPFYIPGIRILRGIDHGIEYIYAHSVSQTVLYSAKDTNDYLAKTIHEFASCPKKPSMHSFITKWMKEFGVGVDYKIETVGGEAHVVRITNFDKKKVLLADKGMGAIRIMTLLFRLAIALPSKSSERGKGVSEMYRNHRSIYTYIIEEPEQNMHPKLQSKLADLFYYLHEEYGYKFIIETHSEYLVRKTQVLVAEKHSSGESFQKNPFKVWYFKAEGDPYEVKYRPDGNFENDFGTGFFDEANKLLFEIL